MINMRLKIRLLEVKTTNFWACISRPDHVGMGTVYVITVHVWFHSPLLFHPSFWSIASYITSCVAEIQQHRADGRHNMISYILFLVIVLQSHPPIEWQRFTWVLYTTYNECFAFVQWGEYLHSLKDWMFHCTRLHLVEWNIPSFSSWKYSQHYTHKHSLFVYTWIPMSLKDFTHNVSPQTSFCINAHLEQ